MLSDDGSQPAEVTFIESVSKSRHLPAEHARLVQAFHPGQLTEQAIALADQGQRRWT
jgi:hypothetical protein